MKKSHKIIKRIYLNISTSKKHLKDFKKIINNSKKIVNEWNGNLLFVYLPTVHRYKSGKEHFLLSDIKNIIKDEKITFIDIHEQVFSKVQDPMKYIPSGAFFIIINMVMRKLQM